LASFGSNVLIENDEDENKIGEAIDRIQRFCHFLIESFSRRFFRRKKSQDKKTNITTQESTNDLPLPILTKLEESNALSIIHEDIEMQPMNNHPITSLPIWRILHRPPDCCPKMISKHFACCAKCIPKSIQEQWTYFRSLAHRFVEHRFFEWFIIFSILVSSITLVS
jgi:hypothetical protein